MTFVTSDIYDLRRIASKIGFEWRESLLCGVGFHGTASQDYQVNARFLLEAAEHNNLTDRMKWASYSRTGEKRSHQITLKSFQKLRRGELTGARDLVRVQLE